MRIISRKIVREFSQRYPDAKKPLDAWYADAKRANWKSPKDIKEVYKNCSIVADNRVLFNIKGNGYHGNRARI